MLRSAGAAATDLAVTDVPEQADEIELVVEALVVEPSAGDAGALDTACATLPPAAPWRPVFDQTDDLGGLLSTRSPLLARAFGRRPVPGGAVEPAPDDEPDGA